MRKLRGRNSATVSPEEWESHPFTGQCFIQLPIGSGGVGISGERCVLELRWGACPYPRALELSVGAASVWDLRFKVLVTNESPLSFERPMKFPLRAAQYCHLLGLQLH